MVHYTGWLWENKRQEEADVRQLGKAGKPFPFALGKRKVIAGWDEGVSTMKVGGSASC